MEVAGLPVEENIAVSSEIQIQGHKTSLRTKREEFKFENRQRLWIQTRWSIRERTVDSISVSNFWAESRRPADMTLHTATIHIRHTLRNRRFGQSFTNWLFTPTRFLFFLV